MDRVSEWYSYFGVIFHFYYAHDGSNREIATQRKADFFSECELKRRERDISEESCKNGLLSGFPKDVIATPPRKQSHKVQFTYTGTFFL